MNEAFSHSKWRLCNSRWLGISLAIIGIDQWVKWSIREVLVPYAPVKLFPWLNFTLAFNRGISFGFLNQQSGWSFYLVVVTSLIIIAYLSIWLLRTPSQQWGLLTALSLILGGALSNLLDRFYFGSVTDFIDFHIENWHFATFNLADVAISIGALVLAGLLFLERD